MVSLFVEERQQYIVTCTNLTIQRRGSYR